MEIIEKERITKIQETMCELDEKIWSKYYPQKCQDYSKPELRKAHLWLRDTILIVLMDKAFEPIEAEEAILSMIKATKYHEEILGEYVLMDEIKAEVAVRKDYKSAFAKVKSGSDLSGAIRYALGAADLKQLATLHKGNQCCRKIEELLTDCNFHYECSKFIKKDYDEFLKES